MKPKVKKEWIKALKSGKYAQGREYLRNKNEQYCCLGVLYDIIDGSWEYDNKRGCYSTTSKGNSTNELGELSTDILSTKFQHFLIDMNDGVNDGVNDSKGHSFSEIADWIETNIYEDK